MAAKDTEDRRCAAPWRVPGARRQADRANSGARHGTRPHRGEGTIRLDDETSIWCFAAIRKSAAGPCAFAILVRGTLAHPSIAIQARNSVAQRAEAVALGVILTPVAAVLAFVDPGLAKDADCAALIEGSAGPPPKLKPPEAGISE